MKILTLHCDYISFKPLKKALKSVDDIKQKKKVKVKEPLVVMMAVEKEDSDGQIKSLIDSVKKTAKEVKAENVVLYPYAHLSSNLAAPDSALSVLKKTEALLKKDFKVTRAPFGYYKTFELKVKGHPLSELSKEFSSQVSKIISHNGISPQNEDTKRLLKEISRSKLDTSKLKENDHRILGQKLDLFSFNESAPGSIFWHSKGFIIMKELKRFIRELLKKYGYMEIATPQILDNRLWKVSGHWQHFKESMFLSEYEKRDFGVKPMNCPGCMLVYKANTRSYKDLPLRYSEFGLDHRKELSGVLSGLFRLVQFTQDDAHIFCTQEQIESEVLHILEMIKTVYEDTFKLNYSLELSTRPEKYMGSLALWDEAEKILEKVLKSSKIKYKINKGAGAFYGPKIDAHVKDSLGRSWQMSTIQLDMQMPKRFEINYIGRDNKTHTPFVIHRAIFGSIERFIGILLEHTYGALPFWISPIQVRILNFTDRNTKAVEKFKHFLEKQLPSLRIDVDLENTTVSEKIRKAEIQKVPHIVVLGDKEEKAKTLAVRVRGEKPKFGISEENFVSDLREKIKKRC